MNWSPEGDQTGAILLRLLTVAIDSSVTGFFWAVSRVHATRANDTASWTLRMNSHCKLPRTGVFVFPSKVPPYFLPIEEQRYGQLRNQANRAVGLEGSRTVVR